ncbi:sigma 54-interacting transcriptional regulator [Neobacillus sp. FSL H8-0543]|uniref:sigma-54 interaction domain-containing protein n=1 Tax=Neobacillus sp. FSL H8-0543 TaxID=2954672 RepID=UPI003158AB2C
MKKISMAIVAGAEKTCESIKEQLQTLFGDYINFVAFPIDKLSENETEFPLVLVSNQKFIQKVVSVFKSSAEFLIIHRTISKAGWDQVVNIPHRKKMLVVNDCFESTQETIAILQELGARHIQMVPYYPGVLINEEINSALCPSELELVPSNISDIVDIGQRVLDTSTLVDLLLKADLLNSETQAIILNYSNTIIPRSQGFENTMNELINTQTLLQRVLNLVEGGVIAFDNQYKITYLNVTAERLFNGQTINQLGENVGDLLEREGLKINLRSNINNQIVKIKRQNYILNKMNLHEHQTKTGGVITFQNAKIVEELDSNLRVHLKETGYEAKYHFDDIITSSPKVKKLITHAKRMSKSDLIVLIQGETGTGKELFAHAIHNYSNRTTFPFVAVNFSSLSDNLLESELFGYEEGAFTGAKKGGKPGLFEQAHKGTIFLDEIGDITPNLQTRLLRVLQQKEIIKVGGTKIIPVDVRIVVATNRDLLQLVSKGQFREDLYYRLKVLQVDIPPLRERKTDIPTIINHFSRQKGLGGYFSKRALNALSDYHWPGNVRELENTIDYLCAMSEGEIRIEDLPIDYPSSSLSKQSSDENNQNNKHKQMLPSDQLDQTLIPQEYLDIDRKTFILNLIYTARLNGQNAGRRSLIGLSRCKGVLFTENEIRDVVNELKSEGLLEVSIGRSGCKVTQKGYRHINK